jgi:hypothetical protein
MWSVQALEKLDGLRILFWSLDWLQLLVHAGLALRSGIR